MAGNTGSIPVRLWSFWNRIKTGERLTEGQRADFLRQADNLAGATRDDLAGHITSFTERGARLTPDLEAEDFTYDYFTGITFNRSQARAGDYSPREGTSAVDTFDPAGGDPLADKIREIQEARAARAGR